MTLQTAQANEPRIVEGKGLLVEETSTNYVKNSLFDDATALAMPAEVGILDQTNQVTTYNGFTQSTEYTDAKELSFTITNTDPTEERTSRIFFGATRFETLVAITDTASIPSGQLTIQKTSGNDSTSVFLQFKKTEGTASETISFEYFTAEFNSNTRQRVHKKSVAVGDNSTNTHYAPLELGIKLSAGDSLTFTVAMPQMEISDNIWLTSFIPTNTQFETRAAEDVTIPLPTITENFAIALDILVSSDVATTSTARIFTIDDSRGNDYKLRTFGNSGSNFSMVGGTNDDDLIGRFSVPISELVTDVSKRWVFCVQREAGTNNVHWYVLTDGTIRLHATHTKTPILNHGDLKILELGANGSVHIPGAYFNNIKIFQGKQFTEQELMDL